MTRFDKSRLPHTQWQEWLFTTTWFLHQWTNNLHICVSWPMVPWFAFPGAYFSGLSDVFECSGGLQMAVVWLEKWNHHMIGQRAWESNWLLFVISRAQVGLRWRHLAVFYVWKCGSSLPLCNHLWYWCKNYLKWWVAILCRVGQLKDNGLVEKHTSSFFPS